jgi:hypothetical protein
MALRGVVHIRRTIREPIVRIGQRNSRLQHSRYEVFKEHDFVVVLTEKVSMIDLPIVHQYQQSGKLRFT